ncbi:hypothetical protein CLOSTASPAR_06383 [[Clostridium] asparagiforme DSM 15981]|uniref:Uncharacterized protein n=1 Tax=[Clostridium] asparagiforme DSM 15981 TaxID=518636 RepID=C0DAS8_9FIRM|nr:hypothetical protein CLOSTASPAR_06383 [[Clostridium] asparagiforme DSM 15981]
MQQFAFSVYLRCFLMYFIKRAYFSIIICSILREMERKMAGAHNLLK